MWSAFLLGIGVSLAANVSAEMLRKELRVGAGRRGE